MWNNYFKTEHSAFNWNQWFYILRCQRPELVKTLKSSLLLLHLCCRDVFWLRDLMLNNALFNNALKEVSAVARRILRTSLFIYIYIYLFLRRASHFEVSKHVGWSIEAFLTNLNIIFDIPIVLKTLKSSSHVFVTSSLCTYWDSCFSMNIQTIAWHLDDIETLFNISFFYFEAFSPTLINTKSPSLHWSEGTHAQRMVKKLRDFRYSIEQARASSPNSSW